MVSSFYKALFVSVVASAGLIMAHAADAAPKIQANKQITADANATNPASPSATVSTGSNVSGSRDSVAVMIDHAKIVRLPERTQTVVVGNPIIADVTIQKNGILVVTGKSYGVTNLIALDNAGTMLAESMISVQAPKEAVVTVQRGFERETYSCTPTCQPSVLLGDANRYFSEVSGQAGQRNSLATQR